MVNYLNEQAQKAVTEIHHYCEAGVHIPVTAVAYKYGMHINQVHQQLKGIQDRTSQKPVNYKLSAIQEASLLSYIKSLDEIGQSIRLDQLSYTANSILQEDHMKDDSSPTVNKQ